MRSSGLFLPSIFMFLSLACGKNQGNSEEAILPLTQSSNIQSATLSKDGKHLYVVTGTELLKLRRGDSNESNAIVARIPSGGLKLEEDNGRLYVFGTKGLEVYDTTDRLHRLKLLGSAHTGGTPFWQNLSLQIFKDYVSTYWESSIAMYAELRVIKRKNLQAFDVMYSDAHSPHGAVFADRLYLSGMPLIDMSECEDDIADETCPTYRDRTGIHAFDLQTTKLPHRQTITKDFQFGPLIQFGSALYLTSAEKIQKFELSPDGSLDFLKETSHSVSAFAFKAAQPSSGGAYLLSSPEGIASLIFQNGEPKLVETLELPNLGVSVAKDVLLVHQKDGFIYYQIDAQGTLSPI